MSAHRKDFVSNGLVVVAPENFYFFCDDAVGPIP